MAQPSLSEILNQPTGAERSTTPLGTSFDISGAGAQIFQAAQMRQQADWQRYSAFTKNIQDYMSNVNEIAKVDVAPEDRPAIMEKMSAALKSMKDNIGAIANPMSDPAAFAAVNQEGASAYSLAMKSKQRHLWDVQMQGYMKQNPEWNTPENRQIVESSLKQPIDSWQAYQLGNPMPAFDINKLGETLNLSSKTPFKTEVIGGAKGKDGKIGAGSENIWTTEGFRYDPELFNQGFEGIWTQQDKYGGLFSDWAKTFVWDKLDETKQKAYTDMGGDPIKNAAKDFVANYRKDDEISESVKENRSWETKAQIAANLKLARIGADSRRTVLPNTQPDTPESIYDYTINAAKLIEDVPIMFSDLPSETKDFLQESYSFNEIKSGSTTSNRIPDDAKVVLKNGQLIVEKDVTMTTGVKRKTYRKYDRSAMDAAYGTQKAKGLSGKEDYKSVPKLGDGRSVLPPR